MSSSMALKQAIAEQDDTVEMIDLDSYKTTPMKNKRIHPAGQDRFKRCTFWYPLSTIGTVALVAILFYLSVGGPSLAAQRHRAFVQSSTGLVSASVSEQHGIACRVDADWAPVAGGVLLNRERKRLQAGIGACDPLPPYETWSPACGVPFCLDR